MRAAVDDVGIEASGLGESSRGKRRRQWRRAAGVTLALGAGMALLMNRTALPPLEGRETSHALLDTAETGLGRALAGAISEHPGQSGIYPLLQARDAFAARVLLARAAERTLDVQYYIWRDDLTGTLLFEELHAAAERGVRVRLLLDDHPVTSLDETLAMLDAHPNVEVRLFNPYVLRRPRLLNFLTAALRLNRRMHNKSFTVDSQVTIIGGRNVGDEYFAATDGMLFADLDVAAVGAVVPEVSRDFDRYWNSEAAYPVARLVAPVDPARLDELERTAARILESSEAAQYRRALRETRFYRDLLEGGLSYEWAPTRLVSDDPNKVFGRAPRRAHLGPQLQVILGEPETELALVSPYFVPGEAGVAAFTQMAARGVNVQILTNSLEATDVAVVQSGYAKHRASLLEGGVRLFELRREGADAAPSSGRWGSYGSSLHAKTFAVDRRRLFVGSFNFDPRSNLLNTELGFVIESPVLAARMSDRFREGIPRRSYEVQRSTKGELTWLERNHGEEVRHSVEPGTSWWQRAGIELVSWLPIEWLL